MEPKKSPKANLENKRAYFTEFGFILTITALLIIFGWKTYDLKAITIEKSITGWDEPPPTPRTEQEKPLPPKIISTPTLINLVNNTTKVKDIDIVNAGDDSHTPTPDYIPIPPIKPDDEPEADDKIVMVADVQPNFPGGLSALYKFLAENLKYPRQAIEANIIGTVHVAFVVERDGKVTNIRLLRGIGGGCDEEAVRVIESMPNWSPGWDKGRPVRTLYNLPVKFDLK